MVLLRQTQEQWMFQQAHRLMVLDSRWLAVEMAQSVPMLTAESNHFILSYKVEGET